MRTPKWIDDVSTILETDHRLLQDWLVIQIRRAMAAIAGFFGVRGQAFRHETKRQWLKLDKIIKRSAQ